jgi:hypothetical protein
MFRFTVKFQRGATMLRFSEEQRRTLADKVPDVANVAAGAMVFGQFLGGQRFSWLMATFGLAIWLVLIA